MLSAREAAEYMDVKLRTVYVWARTQQLPYYKPAGKLIYFKREDLDRFLMHNRIMSRSEAEAFVASV